VEIEVWRTAMLRNRFRRILPWNVTSTAPTPYRIDPPVQEVFRHPLKRPSVGSVMKDMSLETENKYFGILSKLPNYMDHLLFNEDMLAKVPKSYRFEFVRLTQLLLSEIPLRQMSYFVYALLTFKDCMYHEENLHRFPLEIEKLQSDLKELVEKIKNRKRTPRPIAKRIEALKKEIESLEKKLEFIRGKNPAKRHEFLEEIVGTALQCEKSELTDEAVWRWAQTVHLVPFEYFMQNWVVLRSKKRYQAHVLKNDVHPYACDFPFPPHPKDWFFRRNERIYNEKKAPLRLFTPEEKTYFFDMLDRETYEGRDESLYSIPDKSENGEKKPRVKLEDKTPWDIVQEGVPPKPDWMRTDSSSSTYWLESGISNKGAFESKWTDWSKKFAPGMGDYLEVPLWLQDTSKQIFQKDYNPKKLSKMVVWNLPEDATFQEVYDLILPGEHFVQCIEIFKDAVVRYQGELHYACLPPATQRLPATMDNELGLEAMIHRFRDHPFKSPDHWVYEAWNSQVQHLAYPDSDDEMWERTIGNPLNEGEPDMTPFSSVYAIVTYDGTFDLYEHFISEDLKPFGVKIHERSYMYSDKLPRVLTFRCPWLRLSIDVQNAIYPYLARYGVAQDDVDMLYNGIVLVAFGTHEAAYKVFTDLYTECTKRGIFVSMMLDHDIPSNKIRDRVENKFSEIAFGVIQEKQVEREFGK
jgi:hypothetical protein